MKRATRHGLRAMGVTLALLMLPWAATAGPSGSCEPTADAGNTPAQATWVSVPAICTGSLTAGPDEADWYAVAMIRGQTLRLEVKTLPPLLATGIALLDPHWVDRSAGCIDNASAPDVCNARATMGGFWRFGIALELGSGSYQLSASMSAAQTDCGGWGDAGEDGPGAVPLPLASADASGTWLGACTGSFDLDDPRDVYTFPVLQGQQISVTASPPGVAGAEIQDEAGQSKGAGPALADSSGTWRAVLSPAGGGGSASYDISVATQQKDCRKTRDAPNEAPGATFLESEWTSGGPAAITCQGVLDPRARSTSDAAMSDAQDWYELAANERTSFNVDVVAPKETCLDVIAHPPDAMGSPPLRACNGQRVTATAITPISGAWEVQLVAVSGRGGPYSMSLALRPEPRGDCGPLGDAGDSLEAARATPQASSAAPLTMTIECEGTLHASDTDFYAFTVPPTAIVEAAFDVNDPPGLSACLYDAARLLVAGCARAKAGSGAQETWAVAVTNTGNPASYILTITLRLQDDCGSGRDAGDVRSQATRIVELTPCVGVPAPELSGTLRAASSLRSDLDLADWYALSVHNDLGVVAATMTPGDIDPVTGSDFDVCIYAPDDTVSCGQEQSPGQSEVIVQHPCEIPPSSLGRPCSGRADWLVEIRYRAGAFGAYRLTVATRE